MSKVFILIAEYFDENCGQPRNWPRRYTVRTCRTAEVAKRLADKDYGSKVKWTGYHSKNTWNVAYKISPVKVAE